MNDALNNILNRNSHRKLTEPVPSQDEMDLVFQAALRAPDHAWLRPSSFSHRDSAEPINTHGKPLIAPSNKMRHIRRSR